MANYARLSSIFMLSLSSLFVVGVFASRATSSDPALEHSTYLPIAAVNRPFSLELIVNVPGTVTDLQFMHDGSLLIAERNGNITRWDGSSTTTFLDLSDRILLSNGEAGLLGVALSPNYMNDGRFFTTYTYVGDATWPPDTTLLTEWQSDPNTYAVDPLSEQELLGIEQPSPTHNGGSLQFGPLDGYLYVSVGDGHYFFEHVEGGEAAHDLDRLLGKILRLDVSVPGAYSIPPDNPFVDTPGARPEILARGLRNPWRIAHDWTTGALFVGDVGYGSFEEVNIIPPNSFGQNFGWSCWEGNSSLNPQVCEDGSYTAPIHTYGRADGHCSITGGYTYHGTSAPHWEGAYIFADFCAGTIYALQETQGSWVTYWLGDTDDNITTFGRDLSGELFVGAANGMVYRLRLPG